MVEHGQGIVSVFLRLSCRDACIVRLYHTNLTCFHRRLLKTRGSWSSLFQQECSLRVITKPTNQPTTFLDCTVYMRPTRVSHSFQNIFPPSSSPMVIVQLLLPAIIYPRLPHEYHCFSCQAVSPTLHHVTYSNATKFLSSRLSNSLPMKSFRLAICVLSKS
ncbi:hypothetical protein BDR03DRAFT_957233 [Suillus americanus]|nr:hypothetical protein BDR03DRAFT_957233 [Suillus americanus]